VQDWIKLFHRLDIVVGLESGDAGKQLYLARDSRDDAQRMALDAFREFRRRDPRGVDAVLEKEISVGTNDYFIRDYLKKDCSFVWALSQPKRN
jgi:hypothetical protein